jgi:hypothetical protein
MMSKWVAVAGGLNAATNKRETHCSFFWNLPVFSLAPQFRSVFRLHDNFNV